jgi:hypothetical protein
MTDAQLKELAKENNYEPTYELLSFARLALINARALDLAAIAMNIRAAVRQEREECAKVCESEGVRVDAGWASCAAAIRARGQA